MSSSQEKKEEIDIVKVYELRDKFIKQTGYTMEFVDDLFFSLYKKCYESLNSCEMNLLYLSALDSKLDEYVDYSEPTRRKILEKKALFESELERLKRLMLDNKKIKSYLGINSPFKPYKFNYMTMDEIKSALIIEQTENVELNNIVEIKNNNSTKKLATALALGATVGYIGARVLTKKNDKRL